MGLTLRTALIIQDNDNIKAMGTGPDEYGKFTGWILGGFRFQPLLNTEPIYDTEDAAREAMEKIVEEVRAADLSEKVDAIFSPLEAP